MDTGFLNRFKIVLDKIGMLQKAADLTDMSSEQIAKWRDGKAKVPFGASAILCKNAGVSMDWLAFGKGQGPDAEDVTGSNERNLDDPIHANEQFALIPVLDIRAAAGDGAENGDTLEIGHFPIDKQFLRRLGIDPAKAHIIRAHGDSMWPTIADGSFVAINTADRILSDGIIYALTYEGQTRLKRVQTSFDGGIMLISDNKELYPREKISKEDRERIAVAGRVFWTEKVL